MEPLLVLRTVRELTVHRATLALGTGNTAVRRDLNAELNRFFSALESIFSDGQEESLDRVLTSWTSSLTQTDLEPGQSALTRFLSEVFTTLFQVAREKYPPSEAIEFTALMVPALTKIYEKAAYFESQARIAYISNQLQEAQSTLERLEKSKSEFIAVAAHELKTPLTLIEGYTAMLQDLLPQDQPVGAQLLQGVQTGAQRLKNIIDDMIDVSLLDNNLLSLNFQPAWINRLLAVAQIELEPICKERNLTLTVADFAGAAEMTYGDPERLLQVLRNVLANAVKFTPDGGKIVIDGRKLPGFTEVTVADTGIGIALEDQAMIFHKFSRLGNVALHSSGKTKFKGGGPGLGLHIARGIIEAHGGAIWAESPGHDETVCPGSTFHIMIPMRPEPPDDRYIRYFSPVFNQMQENKNT